MVERVSVLGVGVHALDLNTTLQLLSATIEKKNNGYVCLAPAHNVMACHTDRELQNIFNHSLLTVPDGIGVVWMLRLLGHRAGRVYGPDLMVAICQQGLTPGWRHFFLGGKPHVTERLIENLLAQFPTLQVAGRFSPPFRDMTTKERDGIVDQINASKANFVWVGPGSPKQERWMSEMRPRLNVPIMIGVGAAFDFLSGNKPQAPMWIQRAGLEWLFRLATEPRRLWRRYSAYPLFVALALGQLLGLRRYPLKKSV